MKTKKEIVKKAVEEHFENLGNPKFLFPDTGSRNFQTNWYGDGSASYAFTIENVIDQILCSDLDNIHDAIEMVLDEMSSEPDDEISNHRHTRSDIEA